MWAVGNGDYDLIIYACEVTMQGIQASKQRHNQMHLVFTTRDQKQVLSNI